MITRRSFLKSTGATALAAGGGLPAMMTAMQARAADTTGYKALVCVFLLGGLDCHDTILPYDQISYDRYADLRASLLNDYAALPGGSSRARDQLLPLAPGNAAAFGGREFALPPQLSALHTLFQNGDAAIIGNVGPLIESIDSAGFAGNAIPAPKRLFSHNDQQSTWMSFEPEGARYGWGGLFGDAQLASNANGEPAFTAISLTGNEVFLSGEATRPYAIDSNGVQEIALIDDDVVALPPALAAVLREHFESVGPERANLFERDIVDASVRSLTANDTFNASLMDAPSPVTTPFPNSNLGQQLRAVADTINIRNLLNVNRQIFFVATGGFDTHSGQAQTLPVLQQDVSDSIAAFHGAMQSLGVDNDVTAFTASDFGRTLIINGDGTDHGWGGHHFVVGGGVNGGDIYGDIPVFDVGHAQDAGNGRLIPTTSVEEYAASLGAWFGLTPAELAAALPRLSNFTGGLAFV